jgi:NADPH:quinone reductase-like Zn-dependent oxidoreductase
MRAVRYARFGPPDVLEVADVPAPVPAAGELLVRVRAASLNPLDWKIRHGHLRLLPTLARPPRGTGVDFAGVVAGIGGGAGPRHLGERVFGSLSPFGRQGSCAELITVAAARASAIPSGVADEHAASLPIAAGTALQALADDAKLAAGQRVLITGAAGGVGHFAVQVAKHLRAQVVGTCGAGNVDFVRSLGADVVHDYSDQGWLARIGAPFDVVLDIAEAIGWSRARALLVRNGLYIGLGGSLPKAIDTSLGGLFAPWLSGMRAQTFVLKGGPAMNDRLAALVASGAVTPHVARRVGLGDVAEAQGTMESGHGRGKIVVVPEGA